MERLADNLDQPAAGTEQDQVARNMMWSTKVGPHVVPG